MEVIGGDVVGPLWDGAPREGMSQDRRELAAKIAMSLKLFAKFYGSQECDQIEAWLDEMVLRGEAGLFEAPRTVDVVSHRTKYFFGNGYTYGQGCQGKEELLPLGSVDAIPLWLTTLVIQPLVSKGILPHGWVDSVVVNDYRSGGSIVSHVDPLHLFARPILTATFFCPAKLVFGASFDPARTVPPAYSQMLPRGSVLVLDGTSANDVTHGMRPEDLFGARRVSIVLRHVLDHAPTYLPPGTLNPRERSRLIRGVQGRWRDSASKTFFIVRQLSVAVLSVLRGDPDEGEDPFSHSATWRLTPREDGLVCNTGLLDLDGLFPQRLQWKPLTPNHEKIGFTWIRLHGD